jgi:hypothetical protein
MSVWQAVEVRRDVAQCPISIIPDTSGTLFGRVTRQHQSVNDRVGA